MAQLMKKEKVMSGGQEEGLRDSPEEGSATLDLLLGKKPFLGRKKARSVRGGALAVEGRRGKLRVGVLSPFYPQTGVALVHVDLDGGEAYPQKRVGPQF